jgi:tetratricopeptide (TPR) repeat protein
VKHLVTVLAISLLLPALPASSAAEGPKAKAKSKTSKKLRKAAKLLRKEGQAFAKKSNYQAALVAYDRALQTYEAYPMVYNEVGVIHFLQGDLVKASASFRRAIELYPALSVAWANLAEVDRKRKRYVDSATHYKEFVSRRPKVADGFYGLALALMAQDNKAGALWAMKRFVALEKRADPQKIAEVQARVLRLEQEGVKPLDVLRVDEAIAAVKKRIAKAKSEKKGRIKAHKGDQYYAEKAYMSALKAYKKQLKKKKRSKDPSLLYKIGATYAAMRDYRSAMRWWGKALALAPKRSIIFEHMVLAAVQAAKHGQLELGRLGGDNRLEKASEALSQGHAGLALAWLVEPGDDMSTYLRGRAALAGGNLWLAKRCFEALHSAHGEDREIAASLAETLYRLKRSKAAKSVLAKVPTLESMDEQSLLLRKSEAMPRAFERRLAPSGETKVPEEPVKDTTGDTAVDEKTPKSVLPAETKTATPEPSTEIPQIKPGAVEAKPQSKPVLAPSKKKAPKRAVKKRVKPKKKAKAKRPKKKVRASPKAKVKKPRKAKKPRKKRKKKAALEDDDL